VAPADHGAASARGTRHMWRHNTGCLAMRDSGQGCARGRAQAAGLTSAMSRVDDELELVPVATLVARAVAIGEEETVALGSGTESDRDQRGRGRRRGSL
jgi:hypothetical protein